MDSSCGIQEMYEQAVQPLSSWGNILEMFQIHGGHKRGRVCYLVE